MATLEEIIAAVGGLTAINKVAEAVRPAEDTQDPFEALINLVLDDELTTVFRAPLKRLGYDLQSREFRNPFDASDPTLRKVSFATNARIEFYLALVPFWILDDGRREYQAAFALLGATFPKNSTIHMFARDLRDIDRPYRQMFESWQQDRSIRIIFTSWRDVNRLLRTAAAPNQADLVKEMLRLDELARSVAPAPIVEATPPTKEEKSTIIDILARRARDSINTPEEYFNGLLAKEQIRTPLRFDRFDTEASALELVNYLLDTYWLFPESHPRSGERTLGWVLKAVTDQVLSPGDNKKIVNIILNHNLIKNPKALNELRVSIQSGEGGK